MIHREQILRFLQEKPPITLFKLFKIEHGLESNPIRVKKGIFTKKKARIVEGTKTRVEPDQAELLLKSGELILCIVGLYHLIKG